MWEKYPATGSLASCLWRIPLALNWLISKKIVSLFEERSKTGHNFVGFIIKNMEVINYSNINKKY